MIVLTTEEKKDLVAALQIAGDWAHNKKDLCGKPGVDTRVHSWVQLEAFLRRCGEVKLD